MTSQSPMGTADRGMVSFSSQNLLLAIIQISTNWQTKSPLHRDCRPTWIRSETHPDQVALSHQHHAQRKGLISHSVRSVTTSGMQSAASSVYGLAPETLADRDMESTVSAATDSNSNDQSDSGYNESTETVVEEDILEEPRVLYLGPSRQFSLVCDIGSCLESSALQGGSRVVREKGEAQGELKCTVDGFRSADFEAGYGRGNVGSSSAAVLYFGLKVIIIHLGLILMLC
ncbi:unnamed protein product [Mortierella alpina]